MKWIFQRERDRLRRVVNLMPEFVEAITEERQAAHAMAEGLDGRELHGPAVRKLKKVEIRIAQILGGRVPPRNTRKGLSGPEQRHGFLQGLRPNGNIVFGDQAGRDVNKPGSVQ